MEYEPYTLLNSLVGFFPFDGDVSNMSPHFGEKFTAGEGGLLDEESLVHLNMSSGVASTGVGSNVHFTDISVQGSALHFNGHSYLSIPLDLSPAAMPEVTIGAWVRHSPSFVDVSKGETATTVKYIFSNGRIWLSNRS